MSSSWPNLSDLLVQQDAGAPVGLVGAPLDAGSVTPGRCDLAPGLLRATLRRIGRYDVECYLSDPALLVFCSMLSNGIIAKGSERHFAVEASLLGSGTPDSLHSPPYAAVLQVALTI